MSVTLTLILSGQAYDELNFPPHFQRLRIGRSQECEVHIDNLGISRQHCEIVNIGGVHQLRSLGDGKPTFVNGERLESSVNLNDGDLISLGKFTVAYSNSDPWSSTGAPHSKGADTVIGDPTLVGGDKALQARYDSLGHSQGYLVVGEDDQDIMRLEKLYYLFGRKPRAELEVSGWGSPRMAAILVREDPGFRLIDLSPKIKCVRVNGNSVKDIQLSDGDLIEVKSTTVQFFRGRPDGSER